MRVKEEYIFNYFFVDSFKNFKILLLFKYFIIIKLKERSMVDDIQRDNLWFHLLNDKCGIVKNVKFVNSSILLQMVLKEFFFFFYNIYWLLVL